MTLALHHPMPTAREYRLAVTGLGRFVVQERAGETWTDVEGPFRSRRFAELHLGARRHRLQLELAKALRKPVGS